MKTAGFFRGERERGNRARSRKNLRPGPDNANTAAENAVKKIMD